MAQQHIIQSTVRRIFCFWSRTKVWLNVLQAGSSCRKFIFDAKCKVNVNQRQLLHTPELNDFFWSASEFWTTYIAHSITHTHKRTNTVNLNSLWSFSFVAPFLTRIPKTKTTALTSAHLTGNTTPKSPFQLLYKIVTFCLSLSPWARYYWYY